MFERNIRILFDRAEKLQPKDIELPSLNTRITDVSLLVRPEKVYWTKLDFELYFEEPSSITIEMHNLVFEGKGHVVDPETEEGEQVQF